MFQNSFQSGNYLEIFDAKDTMAKGNREKERFYDKLMKASSPQNVAKVFDKALKCISTILNALFFRLHF
jgi:hypothetical protein